MITDAQKRQLEDLVGVFLAENTRVNLSALRDVDSCWIGNVLDSLAFLELAIPPPGTLLDLGTGGGFPLLPLAMLLPKTQFTGLDSTRKKVDALGRIAEKLALRNVTILYGRAEELGRDPRHREQYDVVTARAVAELNVILEYAAPLARVGGRIVAWKSLKIQDELEASLLARAELSCHLVTRHEYELSQDWGRRQLLVFEKMHGTKEKFPRATGVPKKHPIQ